MNSNKKVRLIEMESRTASDWEPIINGFNVIFRLALTQMLSEGLNADDADNVTCCVQEFSFLSKKVLTEKLEKEVCDEN